jgi:Tol biopolymer transport system component
VANPRRFTLDDSTDFPTNWTPDSRAILFSSDRNGTFDVYRQSLDQRTAEAVVAGPDDESGPTAVSPDGAWFYYIVEPKGWRFTQSHGVTLMRTPASGGPRQKVQDARGYQWALCARSPSTTCVLVEQDAKRMVVYALDAVQGKGREITSTPVSNQYYPADLSPDGSRVAIVMSQERRIRILSLQGEPSHDVAIPARPLDPRAFYWSSDGAGWYISSTPPTGSAGSDLLHVDLEGHVKVVWHHNVPEWTSGIPSPDGRHLALTHATIVSNVWMLKDF